MKVLITGGAGYIGYSLVRSLELDDTISEIVIYDNLYRRNFNFFTTGDNLSKTRFVKGDILDDYTLGKHLPGTDVVVHLAAHVDFPYSYRDNYLYEQVNHFGTANLVSELRKVPIQKLVYLSSGAVYGFQTHADESTEPLPENAYGKSKLEGEKYCKLLENDAQVNILRVGNVFGFNPMLRYDNVINKFFLDALLYNKITIYGDGNQTRPFVLLDNMIAALHQAVVNDENTKLMNIVDANYDMNALRDLMMELIPELEFTYVNTNLNLKGYEMNSNLYRPLSDFKPNFVTTFETFKENYKIKP